MTSKTAIFAIDRYALVAFRKLILTSILAVGALASGCNDSAIIWSGESTSPDKHFVASASTEQQSGLGTSGVYTTVYLKQNANKPTAILVLSNETAYPSGVTAVNMNWVTPSHLNIIYKGNATIEFQAIKCAGVEISVEKKDKGPG